MDINLTLKYGFNLSVEWKKVGEYFFGGGGVWY